MYVMSLTPASVSSAVKGQRKKHRSENYVIQMNNCISEGLLHVAAWYRGTPGPEFTKFME